MLLFGVDVHQSTTNSQIKVHATISAAVQFLCMLVMAREQVNSRPVVTQLADDMVTSCITSNVPSCQYYKCSHCYCQILTVLRIQDMTHSCGLITSCNCFLCILLTCLMCPLCYRVEPLFTVKCVVLQIPYYLQNCRFLWCSLAG